MSTRDLKFNRNRLGQLKIKNAHGRVAMLLSGTMQICKLLLTFWPHVWIKIKWIGGKWKEENRKIANGKETIFFSFYLIVSNRPWFADQEIERELD